MAPVDEQFPGFAKTTIFVTYDGDTYWLECFADDPDAEHGEPIFPIDAGDNWAELQAEVAAHQASHGCAPSAAGGTAQDRGTDG